MLSLREDVMIPSFPILRGEEIFLETQSINLCSFLAVGTVLSTLIFVDGIVDVLISREIKQFNIFRIQSVLLFGLKDFVLLTDLVQIRRPEDVSKVNCISAILFIWIFYSYVYQCGGTAFRSLSAFSAALSLTLIFILLSVNNILDNIAQLQLSFIVSAIFVMCVSSVMTSKGFPRGSMTITIISSGLIVLSVCSMVIGVYQYFSHSSEIRENSLSIPLIQCLLIDLTMICIQIVSGITDKLDKIILEEKLAGKEMLIRLVSHETRTPLNIMAMGLKLLEDRIKLLHGNDSDLNDVLDDTKSACDLAIQTLTEVLVTEKISSSAMTLEKEKVDVLSMVQEATKLFKVQAKHQKVALRLVDEKHVRVLLEHCLVIADKSKLQIVLRNLLSNALKFTPCGGKVDVTISVLNDSDRQMLSISVSDTGYGISKENMSSLFREFVQFDAAKLQNGGGSGLGLYTSHALMLLQGGALKVHSEGEGHGCTFTAEIPMTTLASAVHTEVLPFPHLSDACSTVAGGPIEAYIGLIHRDVHVDEDSDEDAEALIDHSNSFDISSISSTFTDTESEKDGETTREVHEVLSADSNPACSSVEDTPLSALVVDDCALNRKMLRRTLVEKKFTHVLEASDGRSAIERVASAMAQHLPLDVVFIDFHMPHMDGPTAVRYMRKNGFAGLIVGVTGESNDEAIKKFQAHGANAVLSKPFDTGMLDGIIRGIKFGSG